MMTSLFSVFDPVVLGFQFNWVSMAVVLMVFPVKYFVHLSHVMLLVNVLLDNVKGLFNEIAAKNYLGMTMVSSSVFFFLMTANLMGLFPFVFAFTSHPFCTLGLGIVFWLSFVFMGWSKNFFHSAAHLVPVGCPIALSPVLVFIELISHLIRPFTISIRLAANIMAGHLIVGLLSSISGVSFMNMVLSIFMQSVLMILEISVAIIQGFVFSILLLLYALDYY